VYPDRLMTGPGDEPNAGKPDARKPDARKPNAGKPNAGKPNAGKHGLAEVRRFPARVIRPHAVRGFPPHLDSAREARYFVLSQLGSRADRALAADAAIVIAELAANAIVHARSMFTVAVSQPGDTVPGDTVPGNTVPGNTVRIAVRDMVPLGDGERLVTAIGHGLDVVAKIAKRWAVEPLPDGKVIWVELSLGERAVP
jgi:hypothetical protein